MQYSYILKERNNYLKYIVCYVHIKFLIKIDSKLIKKLLN